MSQIAVITCHFNWSDYNRPRANLVRFQRQMARDGIPVYGVEAYLEHQSPMTNGWLGWRQVKVPRHAVMFQKEALLNLAESFVPQSFDKLVCCDADLFFENRDWLQATSMALDDHPVVQPFTEAIWLGPDGREARRCPSAAGMRQSAPHVTGHPGFAWAARRELWKEHGGLFPWGVAGRGDIFNSTAFFDLDLSEISRASFGDTVESYKVWRDWAEPVSSWVRGNVGVVAGAVQHDYHGSQADRRYNERHTFVEGLSLPHDVFLNEDGVAQWTTEADPKMMTDLAEFFAGRLEDA